MELHKTGDTKGNNKKVFWSSYVKDWTKLTPEQQCRAFFQNYTATVKVSIWIRRLDAAKLQDTSKVNASWDGGRRPLATKNEVVRAMHLVKYSGAKIH
jgi:hypothetical protein